MQYICILIAFQSISLKMDACENFSHLKAEWVHFCLFKSYQVD